MGSSQINSKRLAATKTFHTYYYHVDLGFDLDIVLCSNCSTYLNCNFRPSCLGPKITKRLGLQTNVVSYLPQMQSISYIPQMLSLLNDVCQKAWFSPILTRTLRLTSLVGKANLGLPFQLQTLYAFNC